MVKFTTTDPGFLGMAGSEPFSPKKKPTVEGEWWGVYIHGSAEDTAGYDIPTIVDGHLAFQPEQPCVVVLKDGSEVSCLLVAWETSRGFSGLICAVDDGTSLEYARKCQAEKRERL